MIPKSIRRRLVHTSLANLVRLAVVAAAVVVAFGRATNRPLSAQDLAKEETGGVPGRVEEVDALTRSTWLIDGTVTDAATSQPIKSFVVIPGSLSTDDQGKSTTRWRENLKREMKGGRLLWPRTSGFSVMRFRVIADGYAPAVTHRIWRGGPHTRLRVRLTPTAKNSAN